jgi:hypothetical protein
MSSEVGPPFRQSSLAGSARRPSTVSMLWKLMRFSGIAVAVPENKNAFNIMILMSFIGFISKSFLVLSKNCSSSEDENWWVVNRSLVGKLDLTLICEIYQ